ncbi:MAG: SGNH/GDSL hydrolase family protein [Luteolibacter sp.]
MNPTTPVTISRRNVLHTAASLAVLGTIGSSARAETPAKGKPALKKGAVILFQGDSITDAGRKKEVTEANQPKGLGTGYAAMIAGQILLAHGGHELKCHNRGISGNKIPDLAARWDQDVIALKPDVLSIMIGVNDLWHTFAFGNKYKATIDDYETGYRALIERTLKKLPGVRIVICEPFTTRTSDEFKPLAQFRAVSKKLAEEKQLTFVPFQSMFDEAVKSAPAEFWLTDGIHPSTSGHAIMADFWRETTGI